MSRLRERISAQAIRYLSTIIIVAIAGIIALSSLGLLLRYGVFGDGTQEGNAVTDEALAALSNIASAAVGGLVGWLTRDLMVTQEGVANLRAAAEEAETYYEPESDDGERSGL